MALLGNRDLGWDPAYAGIGGKDNLQSGTSCVGGVLDGAFQTPEQAFQIVQTPGAVRLGSYSAYINLPPGGHSSYSCLNEAVLATPSADEGEGDEVWWAWSLRLPIGWAGSAGWGTAWEWTVNAYYWPSMGILNIDLSDATALQLIIHTGFTPRSTSQPTYNATERLLSTSGSPKLLEFGKWIDIIYHATIFGRQNGVLQVWLRTEGETAFTLAYSDVPGDSALVQRAPHPTSLYNTEYGAPGENPALPKGGHEYGYYSGNTAFTRNYWHAGMFRRQSFAACLALFGAASPPPPPSTNVFGKTTSGINRAPLASDYRYVAKFTLGVQADVRKLVAYLGPAASVGSQKLKGIIYDAAAAGGEPGSLLAASNEITIGGGDGPGWRDLAFASAPRLNAGDYWLGVHVGGPDTLVAAYYYDVVGGALRSAADVYSDGTDAAFGTSAILPPDAATNVQPSIYGAYDPVATTGASGTFGKTAIGASTQNLGSDYKTANKFTLAKHAKVSKLTVRLGGIGGAAATEKFKGVIYSDSSGSPNTLLATSSEVLVGSDAAAAWVDLTFAQAIDLAAGDYWLGLHFGGSTAVQGYWDTVANAENYNVDTYSDGPANPFGAVSVGNRQYSIYASYTEVTSGTSFFGNQVVGASQSGIAADTKRASKFTLGSAQTIDKVLVYLGPPVKTFGKTTVGATFGASSANYKRAIKATLTEAGVVSKLRVYLDGSGGGSGSQVHRGVIYADSAGSPGALKGTTAEVSVSAGAAGAWLDLAFSPALSLTAGDYWIGFHSGPTTQVSRHYSDTSVGARRFNSDTYSDGASDPFGTATTGDGDLSVHAVYSPTGTQVAKAVIYADSAGAPGALKATSAEVSLSAPPTTGWVTFSISPAVALTAGDYWLGILGGATGLLVNYFWDALTNGEDSNANVYTSGASDPFGASPTQAAKNLSVYATAVGAAGGVPTRTLLGVGT